jgi:hypothetical protein
MVDVDDIVGVAELAAEFNTSRATISNWPNRYADYPAPLKSLASGPLYSLTAVRAWHDGRTWAPGKHATRTVPTP